MPELPFEEIDKKVREKKDVISLLKSTIETLPQKRSFIGEKLIIAALSCENVIIKGRSGSGKFWLIENSLKSFPFKKTVIFGDSSVNSTYLKGRIVHEKISEKNRIDKGTIFTNYLIIRNINRIDDSAISALKEVSDYRKVNISGYALKINEPFSIFATTGEHDDIKRSLTLELLDRFSMEIELPSPNKNELDSVFENLLTVNNTKETPISENNFFELKKLSKEIYISDEIKELIKEITLSIINPHSHPQKEISELIEPHSSIRAFIHLINSSKIKAILHGRGFVIPEDVIDLSYYVFPHRFTLKYRALREGLKKQDIIDMVIKNLK